MILISSCIEPMDLSVPVLSSLADINSTGCQENSSSITCYLPLSGDTEN